MPYASKANRVVTLLPVIQVVILLLVIQVVVDLVIDVVPFLPLLSGGNPLFLL